MSRHVVANEPWGVIDIDTHEGGIFMQQDWHYLWQTIGPLLPQWTIQEKRDFHHTLDQQIWQRWSLRKRFKVSGKSEFATAFGAAGVPINFDVRWVLQPGHWNVNAFKVAPGSSVNTYRSNVTFATRSANLYSIALLPYSAANVAHKSNPGFLTMPHEFGHMLGAPDEYTSTSPHLADDQSIMNIGRQIRDRHLDLILKTLNKMLPDTVFAA